MNVNFKIQNHVHIQTGKLRQQLTSYRFFYYVLDRHTPENPGILSVLNIPGMRLWGTSLFLETLCGNSPMSRDKDLTHSRCVSFFNGFRKFGAIEKPCRPLILSKTGCEGCGMVNPLFCVRIEIHSKQK